MDLVTLIGRHVDLKQTGGVYQGLCPFHDEKSPSFTVTPSRGTWRCFGCDENGDAVGWKVKHEGLDFRAAVQALAAELGIDLPAEVVDSIVERDDAEQPESAKAQPADTPPEEAPEPDTEQLDELAVRRRAAHAPDVEPLFDVAGLARFWTLLSTMREGWTAAVRGWAVARGLGAAIAHRLPELGDVAAVPIGIVAPDLREMVEQIRWRPLDLFTAIRDEQGAIVDINRRYVGGGPLPDSVRTKTARLSSTPDREPAPHIKKAPSTVMFGRLDLAVEAAANGEPVVIVEGDADYLAVAAACAIRGHGAVLGVVGKTHDRVAQAFTKAVSRRRPFIREGSFDVFLVPDIDSNGGGERHMWSAGVTLLDVGRVTWCPPTRRVLDEETGVVQLKRLRQGDLGDAISGHRDPVAAIFELLDSGFRMYETIDPYEQNTGTRNTVLRRWRSASDEDLVRAFYRLPLDELTEYMHWHVPRDQHGVELDPVRGKGISHRGAESGTTRHTRMVQRWMAFHGIVFVAATGGSGGQYVWDQVDRAELRQRQRTVPRLIKVGGKAYWDGWLQAIGMFNPAETLGKKVDRALKQAAQRAQGTELRAWMTADGALANPRLRLHLHGAQERVACVDGKGIELRSNRGKSILIASPLTAPIEWMSGVSTVETIHLLWQLIGQYISIPARERAMAMAWALAAPIRERLEDRPMFWATGAAEAGKTFYAKLLMTLFYGAPSPGQFTTAARWEAARTWPILTEDNGERRHLSDEDEQFLLTVTTSVARHRRSSESDWDTVMQDGRALIHLSAIGRPWNPELQRRSLLVEHHQRHHAQGMRPSETIDALRAARSTLWSGIMRLYSERIIPCLGAREHQAYADQFPSGHPLAGMREALGVMGVIADVLTLGDANWGRGGPEMVGDWVDLLKSRANEAARNNDPLAAALDELLWDWNRKVKTLHGDLRQPSIDDALYQCQPLYDTCPMYLETEGPVTLDFDRAEIHPNGEKQRIVGFQGTYPQLHRDMVHRDRSMRELFPSADEIRHSIGQVDSWRRELAKRRGPRGLRIYRWWQPSATVAEEPAE